MEKEKHRQGRDRNKACETKMWKKREIVFEINKKTLGIFFFQRKASPVAQQRMTFKGQIMLTLFQTNPLWLNWCGNLQGI